MRFFKAESLSIVGKYEYEIFTHEETRQPQSIEKSKKPPSILSAPEHNSSQKVDDQISNIYESSLDSEWRLERNKGQECADSDWENWDFLWSEKRDITRGVT